MDYLEIIKYLHQDELIKNPPAFNQKLITIERLDSVLNFKQFLLEDESNKSLFLTYVIVSFNWIMKSIIENKPDLYNLTNLQFKVLLAKGMFDDKISNHYIDMIHAFLSSIAIYYCDKSNEALVEFNMTMGTILTRASDFWINNYQNDYLNSKIPEGFLENTNKCACSSDRGNASDCKC